MREITEWPKEYDYPVSLTLTGLLIRSQLTFNLLRFIWQAWRDGVLIAGLYSRASTGAQRPSCYTSEPKAWRRWYRFLRECVLPTVFIRPEVIGGIGFYAVEGYEFTIWIFLIGKAWSYGVGRRGTLMYEPLPDPEPPDEYPTEYTEPPREICPTCQGSGLVGEKEGRTIYVCKEPGDLPGVIISVCEDCDGEGSFDAESDEPDCIPKWGGGYSLTGY